MASPLQNLSSDMYFKFDTINNYKECLVNVHVVSTRTLLLQQERDQIKDSHSCLDKIANEKRKIAAQQSGKFGEKSHLLKTQISTLELT